MTVPTTSDLIRELTIELREVSDEVPHELPPDRQLGDELGVDSLDLVEFVARIEQRYRFVVPDEDWQELRTLDQIAAYVIAHASDG